MKIVCSKCRQQVHLTGPCRTCARFWAKVDKSAGPDACWPWTAARFDTGYGSFNLKHRQSTGAHRLAWILTNGAIPEGHGVLHRCDNRGCCNPRHLFTGTHSDNMRDAAAKGRLALQVPGRIARVSGPLHPQARLSSEQVEEVRRLYAAGKITQRELATRFGVSEQTIGHIVRRERRLA